jgi:uncharacterized surface protein with fasciclin (FAS1) repeats
MNEIERAIEAAGYKVFAEAVAESDYGQVLASGKPYTIFAPTDAAFAKFPDSSLEHLRDDMKLLRSVVGYHFAAGKVLAQRFAGKRIRAKTYAGESLVIEDLGGLHVNKARLVQADLIIGACVLHGIDGVLWPLEPAQAAL